MQRVFWKWFALGLGAALFLVWAQSQAVGGLAGLLQVGETSLVRPLIEGQLGSIPLAEGPGHDGQTFYSIALDLNGDTVGPLLDHPAYRYRRILFPLLASGFGLLEGWPLLYSMIGLGVISMAVSSGLVATMAAAARRSQLLALAVVLNPGIWLSVQLVTSDALALGLMIVGLFAFTRRKWSSAPFALSALAKDVSLATPVPLGVRCRDWKVVYASIGALLIWMTFLTVRFGDGFASRGNLDWPLFGLVDASRNWASLDRTEWVYVTIAILTVALGIIYSMRRTWLRWPVATWTGLALISSSWVWDFGNNALRAFSPILVLVALSGTYSEATATSETIDPPAVT